MRTPPARHGVLATVTVMTVLAATAAAAHGDVDENANPWLAWNVTLDIALGALLAAGLYARGVWRLKHKIDNMRIWRHVSFLAGLAAVFLALQSPIDAIAERSFFMHQVQHVLMRMIGPMLIFLSAPQAILVAGTPEWLRRGFVTRIVTTQIIRDIFGDLTHPVVATALFIGVLYFWQIPEFHDAALLNNNLHYVMHASMIFAGLLFFWRIFDPRPAPLGARYGVRLMMLWIAVLSNIAIGSYLALKSQTLYAAYDMHGRLWHPPLTDEQLGAAIIWIPNSMMGLAAVLIVIHLWGRQETKDERRRAAKLARHGHGWNEPPMTAATLYRLTAGKNRATGLGLAFFSLCVFVAAILVGVINLSMGTAGF